MTEQEAKQTEMQLTEMFKAKFFDIKCHIDIVGETDKINISFFWNRISIEKWNDSKNFRIKDTDFQHILENEIIPFFNSVAL